MTISYADGTSASYTYDSANQRLTMVDATGTTSYAYDAAGELTSVTAPGTGTVGYTYTPVGLEASLTYPVSGQVVNYGYDPANRLTSVTDWQNLATTYGYDAAGRLASIAYPNGVAPSYGYDTAGRLASVGDTKGTTSLFSAAYTRDAVGNPTQVVEAGVVPSPGTTTYGYDAANQLVSATYPGASTASWGYDPVGNRTSATLNGTTTPATYDAADRLLTSGSTTDSYDANGNLLCDGTTTYMCDARNLLVGVSNSNLTASYTYDGNGYRVAKTINGGMTSYAWDRTGQGGLGTVIAKNPTSAATSEQYVFGSAGLQEGTPRVARQGLLVFVQEDGLGSPRLTTDSGGTVQNATTYGS